MKLFPIKNTFWTGVMEDLEAVREIRLRAGCPILLYRRGKELCLDKEGSYIYHSKRGKCCSYEEIQELLNYWCEDSRYAFQEEIRRGFLTISGGHRIGITGECVYDTQGSIQTIKYITSLNIRIAHEVKGIANSVMPWIMYGGKSIHNTLIISPPGAGKTTLLRDIVRQISDGNEKWTGRTVGVVDERSEIAACFKGLPQLDVGKRTDVLDGCYKAVGMMMLLRSMAPEVIAADEIGSVEDVEALKAMVGNGCGVLATIHGNSIEEIKEKDWLKDIFRHKIFEYFVVLDRQEHKYSRTLYQAGEKKECFVWQESS